MNRKHLFQLFDLEVQIINCTDCRIVGDLYNHETGELSIDGMDKEITDEEVGQRYLSLEECKMEPTIVRMYLGPFPGVDADTQAVWLLFKQDGAWTLAPVRLKEVHNRTGLRAA
ncbi:hypothetical protein OV203_20305 [Nannocystis sp. ILAH1]|uniref:hypothetical protein n=1 Tax=Nannocystis sp. ILAH1 TaxID=2996789 RepID=UPI002270D0A2|nr:hypothetical protein [Nannocystis sp. ILAH1]MCY0989494.1 hypothetical protein [Nannocystis sp. ILAH1]